MLRDLEVVGIKQYFDVNNLYEQPVMELCNPNKRQLTIYSEVQDLKLTLRFTSVSEMTFTIYKDEKRGDMQFELTRKQIQTIIKELQENEFVERQGSARSGKWVVKHIQKTD